MPNNPIKDQYTQNNNLELNILKRLAKYRPTLVLSHTLVCFFDVVELAESQLEEEEEEEEKADEMGLWESTRARTYSFT